MSAKIRLSTASVTTLMLAKVGNPLREEPLQTSREILRVNDDDRELLTTVFLKPFKNLPPHRFQHHSSLSHHEMNQLSGDIFAKPGSLLKNGCDIARRLYSKSNHPNIKSGDLCIALVDDIEVDGNLVQALCILKSETVVPFLSISAEDGDLRLRTEEGINPDKIDKGCLVLNHLPRNGYYVFTFDRSGGETRFWNREFLGLQAIPDSAFLTNTFAQMAVKAVKHQLDETQAPEESGAAAREVIAYFDDRENFDLEEFEQKVLKTPDAVARFNDEKQRIEEDHGEPLQGNFEISPKDVKKVRKHAAVVLKLDVGVEIHIKPSETEPVLERGFDEAKGMKFVKVYYNEDVSPG